MEFVKYQHLERLGTTEVQNIELGECYIFPKIDGTNASVWKDSNGVTCAGSRNRKLTLEKDNGGFLEYVSNNSEINSFLFNNKGLRLFGEWLIPHTLKTYRDDTWRKFYVFDVMDSNGKYLHYEDYKPLLEHYNLNYISPISIIDNPSEKQIFRELEKNDYLIQDGKGKGEGIVIKNYSFVNQFGRTTWAKVVSSEFKENNRKEFGASKIKGLSSIEKEIVDKFVTKGVTEKTKAKITLLNNGSFVSKDIPRLLNTVFYELVTENAWEFIKINKFPVIDFKKLKAYTFDRVKELNKTLF